MKMMNAMTYHIKHYDSIIILNIIETLHLSIILLNTKLHSI